MRREVFPASCGVEFAGEVRRHSSWMCNILPLWQLFQGSGAEAIEKLRVELANVRDHFADDGAGFAGSVRGGAHAPEAMKDDTGDGVHHGGEGGDRQDVAGDFDGAFFGGALDFLNALGMRHRADVPDVAQNGRGRR